MNFTSVKENDWVNVFLHKIKEARDKLRAVGVNVDNDELLHIVPKGLPREYHPLCFSNSHHNWTTFFWWVTCCFMLKRRSFMILYNLARTVPLLWLCLPLVVKSPKIHLKHSSMWTIALINKAVGRGRSNQSSQNSFQRGTNSESQNQFTRSEGRPSC